MDIIEYDSEADILIIRLDEGKILDEKLLDNDIILGVGKDNKIMLGEWKW